MSLASQVSGLAVRIGTEFKTVRTEVSTLVGSLSSLTTTNKTDIVSAINEVKASSSGAPPDASEITKGVVELATNAETTAGIDTVRATTPAGVAASIAANAPAPADATTSTKGIVELATDAETVTGTDTVRATTPKSVAAAIAGKANTSSLATVATTGNAADLTGTLGTAQLPPLAINDTFVVVSQAAMVALTAQRGDIAIRSDTSRSYILATDSPATLADWKLLTAAGDVVSVAGRAGAVVLSKTDVGLANVDNTSDANKPVSAATTTQLNLKQPIDDDLTAIAALASAADKLPYATGSNTWALTTFTAAGRALVDDVDIAAQRTTLSVYSQAEVGDPATDFVATFVAALV